ncbi:MAG: hypothetical protein ABI895_07215 [Deltaproteobacteria bacterium]
MSHDIELDVSLDPPSLTGKGSVLVKAMQPTSVIALVSGKGARSSDLRKSLEAASKRDLGAFFDRWVYAPAADL